MNASKNKIEQSDDTDFLTSDLSEKGKNKKTKKKKKKKEISFAAEIKRKAIHINSLLIPLIYIFVTKNFALTVLFILMVGTVAFDLLSKKNAFFRNLLKKYLGDILRKHELKKKKIVLNGGSWMTISAFFVVLIFPKFIAVVAMTIIVICDISSALIGKRFGRNKLFKKSWEGSVSFFLAGVVVIWTYYFIFQPSLFYLLFGFIGVFIAAVGESASKNIKIDDNLLVPSVISIILYLGELYANIFNQSFIYILK